MNTFSMNTFSRMRVFSGRGRVQDEFVGGWRAVTIYLAPRRGRGPRCGTALPPWSSGQPGDEPGARSPSIRPCSGWGLAAGASPQRPGALTARFHPCPDFRDGDGAVCFCATFRLLRRTDPLREPGSYPAPCPAEPGLSSPTGSGRPPGPLGLRFYCSTGGWGGQPGAGLPDGLQVQGEAGEFGVGGYGCWGV